MRTPALLLACAALVLGASIGANATAPMIDKDAIITGTALPKTLSEYGFFRDPAAQVPDAGVTPYRLNMPLFSDGAEKLRFVYVPDGAEVGIGDQTLLDFPVGSALIKTFAFGEGADRRLIETRGLLHAILPLRRAFKEVVVLIHQQSFGVDAIDWFAANVVLKLLVQFFQEEKLVPLLALSLDEFNNVFQDV